MLYLFHHHILFNLHKVCYPWCDLFLEQNVYVQPDVLTLWQVVDLWLLKLLKIFKGVNLLTDIKNVSNKGFENDLGL